MSVNGRPRKNSRKIKRYKKAVGSGSAYARTPVKRKKGTVPKFILFIVIIAAAAGIVCGIIFVMTPDVVQDKVDDIQRLQYPKKYSGYVKKYSSEYGVDQNLVYGVIRTESRFNPNSKSDAGAMGLMQITPDCFDFLKQNIPDDNRDYDVSELYNPEINIKYGTYFLSYLLDKYGNIEKTALAAYNAGFGTVDLWLEDPSCSADGKNLDVILYPETESYVKNVAQAKDKYSELY